MAENGVKTTDLISSPLLDEFLGNYQGNTKKINAADFYELVRQGVGLITQFSTRDLFVAGVAANLATDDGSSVFAGGLFYTVASGATDIADLPGYKPSGVSASPAHWGAVPGTTADYSVEIQAAADYAKSSWVEADKIFKITLDFMGQTFRADSSIDYSGLRQPRLTVRNGLLYSKAVGKIAFDLMGTNGAIIDNFRVYGADDAPPAWGFGYGRALIDGSNVNVDGVTFIGKSGAWGYFDNACALAFAAEVSEWGPAVFWHNKSRSTSACCAVDVDNMQTIVDHFGSAATSDFQTLPSIASGAHSNILHNFGAVDIRRTADFNLVISSITEANPAVITVAAGTLAGAALSNGDEIYISGGDMVEVAYKTFTVANINSGADTFELLAEDATGHTAYTAGGLLQNRTGPAMLSSGSKNVSATSAYFLTFGAPEITFDLNNGGTPSGWNFKYQSERHTDNQFTFLLASGTKVLQGFNIHSVNTNQNAATSIFRIEGAGIVRIDRGSLTINNMGVAPTGTVLSPQGQFDCRAFDISVPLAAALPDPSLMFGFSGIMAAEDRSPVSTHHGMGLESVKGAVDLSDGVLTAKNIDLVSSPTGLTSAGLRWSGDRLATYREGVSAERVIQVQDSATTGDFTNAAHRINTDDKYAGKMVFNVSTGKPMWATGGLDADPWATWP